MISRIPRARLVFNRDERRTRAIAVPPSIVQAGRTTAVMPIDPDGRGTWIAANDAGLIFVVLNAYDIEQLDADPAVRRSRGLIIPELIEASSLEDARGPVRRLDPREFSPFRLLVFGEHLYLDARPGATSVSVTRHVLQRRFMATSSSVRPHDAAALRAGLFRELVVAPVRELQDRFHAHRWPECPELSVDMTRDESCTVSRTVVERFADRVAVRYQTADSSASSSSSSLTLGLASSTMRLGAA